MFDKATVVAGVFLAAVSGAAAPAIAQTKDKSTADKAFQDCKGKGGWYQREIGVCEVESNAKAAAMRKDEQACQAKGGWLQKELGVCEMELKEKAKK